LPARSCSRNFKEDMIDGVKVLDFDLDLDQMRIVLKLRRGESFGGFHCGSA
jgi:hypothetical protein